MNRLFKFALGGAVGFFLFYHLGRGIWHPLTVKARGGNTIEEVVEHLRARMVRDFSDLNALTDRAPIALIGLKEERTLEFWKDRGDGRWELVKTYPFTGFSGSLGPKLREGDEQIPEGIYAIDYLNPNSSYHLSLKLNYPNAKDWERARKDGRENPGSEIFIHGRSATIGCIPVGDRAIEEIFFLVAENGLTNTAVILAPYDLRTQARRLDVPGIDWEQELYDEIRRALTPFEKSGS